MTDQSLQINLSDDALITRQLRWVHLTQPVEDGMDKTASMFDLAQMVAFARSGKSAFTYKRNECTAGIDGDGNVNVRIDFESWPSFPGLKHTISSSFGNVSLPTIIEEYTEFSIIFGKTDAVELDFILKDITAIYWESDCCDLEGQLLLDQPIELDGLTTLRTDQPIFGVARIRGTKVGARHTLTAKLIKAYPIRPDTPLPEEGITNDMLEEYWAYTDVATWNGEPVDETETVDMTGLSLDNLSITVKATWKNDVGEDESESMRLTIPQCVKDLLSTCGDNLEAFGGGISICKIGHEPDHLTVYVSTCSNKVIEERNTRDDPNSWCE